MCITQSEDLVWFRGREALVCRSGPETKASEVEIGERDLVTGSDAIEKEAVDHLPLRRRGPPCQSWE